MKKIKWLLGILLLALVPMLQSCDDDGYSIGDFSWDWGLFVQPVEEVIIWKVIIGG